MWTESADSPEARPTEGSRADEAWLAIRHKHIPPRPYYVQAKSQFQRRLDFISSALPEADLAYTSKKPDINDECSSAPLETARAYRPKCLCQRQLLNLVSVFGRPWGSMPRYKSKEEKTVSIISTPSGFAVQRIVLIPSQLPRYQLGNTTQ
jgi:hypothetical protein